MPEAATPTTATEAKQDGKPPASEVERRVAELREQAARSPEEARDACWQWFEELGEEVGRDRAAGTAKLNELFRTGTPPAEIDGRTEGILVAPLIAGPVDGGLRRLARLWMPWQGKRFVRAE